MGFTREVEVKGGIGVTCRRLLLGGLVITRND